jgi:MFS family permease
MLTILAVVYAFHFVDRQVVSLLIEDIKADMRLSDTQMGLLTGMAFALFYSTLGIPIARWADRGNRITIISLSTALWSVMVLCCGMVGAYWQLLLARVGAAVGEAGCLPPAQSLIAEHYDRRERARAMSLFMMGGQASLIVSSVAAGWLNQWYGWRATFLILGVPGLLLALIVRVHLREPRLGVGARPHKPPDAAERAGYIADFRTLWRHLAYRHLTASYAVISLFGFGVGQWMIPFLIRTHGIDTGELGSWYALIWGVGGAVGTFAGGYLASGYAADKERLQLKIMAALLVAFIPLYLGIYLTHNISLAFGLMTVGALFYTGMMAPLFAMIQQIVAPNMRALAIAVLLLASNLIGMGLGPFAVGALSDFLAPRLGEESLRVALVMWTPGYLWGAFHLFWARRYVRDGIESSCAKEQATLMQTAN